ncbi:Lrp/AsnC family transcriptional regulator [Nocardia sp. NPDC020380]|uniref:Lrp/AsnC family transcriptional regulator n=1 Tax=Nocardia sp. NPDC020380 TaxID=3364309 RepID=UPI0037A73195
MQESINQLDELDYLLITALQVAPRADWQTIGAALGVDATTASRRWARLEQSGNAWMSSRATRLERRSAQGAAIEVHCAPGRVHEIARSIGNDEHVLNLEHLSGRRNLLVMAIVTDLAQLARYRDLRLAEIPGVTGLEAQPLTTVHADAGQWRLDRLDDHKLKRLAPLDRLRSDYPPARAVHDRDLPLANALSDDPRASLAQLATLTGLSTPTVRRRLAGLEADGALTYRIEVARAVSGWPIGAALWCTTDPANTTRIARELAQLRETRMCAELTGPHNLLLQVWLRSVDDLAGFEKRLGERIPGLTIADRAVTLWPVKLGGHLLDPQGRHLRAVPLRLWNDDEFIARERDAVALLAGDTSAGDRFS